MKNYIGDIFILSGLLSIVIAAFFVSKILGLIVTGAILVILGVIFIRYPPDFKNRR